MRLLINLATRGRPAILVDTIQKTLKNFGHPDTRLMVSVDADDAPTLGAMGIVKDVILNIHEREDTIAEKWNRAMEIEADLYMPLVDHTVPSTLGFDRLMIQAAQRL